MILPAVFTGLRLLAVMLPVITQPVVVEGSGELLLEAGGGEEPRQRSRIPPHQTKAAQHQSAVRHATSNLTWKKDLC